ncbi:ferredoxin--NADP reductase [Arenicella xantha]|uniref:ferredoxin--NADP(+) reductase n=1 Tax=Arenicella xantha TaxID=644221 RepID=A0A395JQI6_9GAMM|nr:ferredoxin--NADP reductase [Arenicella xantha]RBP52706.1 ferredoxin--NADP+ reductase [Arenicella xantha]
MAANIQEVEVLTVHHWNDTLFSFTTTRDPGFRFLNGQFIMIGLMVDGKPLMRAYSIASANYEEHMEFFSIKVQDGPLTSRLQKIQPGDKLLTSTKPTGTLLVDNLKPGKNLYLLATGTGLAPFMSVIKDPEVYERYDKVILTHGVREVSELAYQDIINELPENEFFGEMVKGNLLYYPTVTREDFHTQGRLTDALTSGKLAESVGLPPVNVEDDRFMLCGSPSMLKDFCVILDGMGFKETIRSDIGEYVIERAFVET